MAVGILACRTARPVDVWLGQPVTNGRPVSERQRQDLGREQVAGLGVEAEQGQGLGGKEGRSRVTVDELFLRGSNQRTKMKRLRRVYYIAYLLSRETRSRSTSVIGLVLYGWG